MDTHGKNASVTEGPGLDGQQLEVKSNEQWYNRGGGWRLNSNADAALMHFLRGPSTEGTELKHWIEGTVLKHCLDFGNSWEGLQQKNVDVNAFFMTEVEFFSCGLDFPQLE